MTGAAERLVVTQPSVSAAVTALSNELGVQLTEKVGRGIRLDQGRRPAAEALDPAATELRIAAVTTAAEYIVPPLLQAFAAAYPEIGLTLEVGNRERVFRYLRDHAADVASGGSPPGGSSPCRDLAELLRLPRSVFGAAGTKELRKPNLF